MISEFILWQGYFQSLYENEITDWTQEILSVEAISEDEITRLNLADVADCDDSRIQSIFDGDSLLFEPRKVIIIDHLEAWDAARINVLIKGLKNTDVECFIACTQRTGAVLKSVKEVLSDDPRVRKIPDSVKDMANWVMDWLEDRHILIEEDAAYKLVEHAGEDSEILVSTIVALSTIPDRDKMLTWDDVKKYAGDIGSVAAFKITSCITEGDSEGALRVLDRINGTVHPLQLLKMLSNRYRQYLLIVGGPKITDEEIVALTQANPKALYYTRKEAQKLGLVRAIKCLGYIDESYHDVKGIGPLGEEDSMRVLITRLSHSFRLANTKR